MADIVDNSTPEDGPVFEVRDLPDDQAPGHATDYGIVGPAPSDVRRYVPAPQASGQAPVSVTPPGLGGSMAILGDNDIPGSGPVFKRKRKKPHYDQITRRWFALVVLIPTAVYYGGILAALIFGKVNRDDLTAMVAAISPFQALAAAVIGFYFAKRDDEMR